MEKAGQLRYSGFHIEREDLERLFSLLATDVIRPHVAERISFDKVAEAHRRLEAGGLEGKLVLCPDFELRRDWAPRRKPKTSLQASLSHGNRTVLSNL
jgi:Zinc-binding dehydrogenase